MSANDLCERDSVQSSFGNACCILLLGFSATVWGINRKENEDLPVARLWKVQVTFTDFSGNLKQQIF